MFPNYLDLVSERQHMAGGEEGLKSLFRKLGMFS